MLPRALLLVGVIAACSDESVVVTSRQFADANSWKDGALLDSGTPADAVIAEVAPADDATAADAMLADAATSDTDSPDTASPDAGDCACPAGYTCFDGGCVPAPSFACAPCTTDATCLGGECKVFADGGFCLIPCEVDATGASSCPAGFACTEGRCRPATDSCTCTADKSGTVRACPASADLGPCGGQQTCTAAGWAACLPTPPSSETCNGLDDDCDGQLDEGTSGGSCGTGACAGQWLCSGGALACSGPSASSETCNGVDDDCDGQTDEALGGDACGVGACAGVLKCASGKLGCSGPLASVEVCNGVDDDCDGQTDDGTGGKGCGVGACSGQEVCVGGVIGCAAPAAMTETCNGIDDDCDGQTDDGTDGKPCALTNLVGACLGKTVCLGASGLICDAAKAVVETCNGADDDCDGQTDEGWAPYATPAACGGCQPCPGVSGLHAAATCTAGKCGFACESGWIDMDGQPGNGCECLYLGAEDQPDGVDQNCDGIDGEVDNGIFVAKTGSDGNPGSRELPLASVQKALVVAEAAGKRDIYVGAGVYSGSLALVPGVSVYGGYGPGYGARDTVTFQSAIVGTAPAQGPSVALECIGIAGEGTPTRVDGLTVLAANAKGLGQSSYALFANGCDQRLQVSYCQLQGGDGAAGLPGLAGQNGMAGLDGKEGMAAKDIGHLICTDDDASAGGSGGASACGTVDASGGAGGSTACPVFDQNNQAPQCPQQPYVQVPEPKEPGQSGQGVGGGAGGASGADAYIDSYKGVVTQCLGDKPTCNLCRLPLKQLGGDDGDDGPTGGDGAGGSGCGGGASWSLATGFVPSTGGEGAGGNPGGGGGGGGAAGGVEVRDCAASSAQYTDMGGSGGGGGGGGCGGSGGKGGGGGGGSFAVFLIAPASGSLPLLLGNTLASGSGGAGGSGGPAGSGAAGGAGGKGGKSGEESSATFCTSKGGNGGAGGHGGHGGGGGGGCGGPSVLLAVANQKGAASKLLQQNVAKLGGQGGVGGQGGPSIGDMGKAGAAGAVVKTLEL